MYPRSTLYENPIALYAMFGKFLNRRHQFKDCEIIVEVLVQFLHKEVFIGKFPVSNVIALKPTEIAYVSESPDLIELNIIYYSKSKFNGSATISIEIN